MRLGIFSRLTANALSSFLLAAGMLAQAPASTAPVSAAEKALQVISYAAVTSIDCTSNAATIATCLGGPITTSGTFTLTFGTQTAGQILMGPAPGAAAAIPAFGLMTQAYRIANGIPTRYTGTNCIQTAAGTDITNTATETTYYSCLVTGGDMTANSVIVIHIAGTGKYDVGSTGTLTPKLKAGCADAVAANCAAGNEIFSGSAMSPPWTAAANLRPIGYDIYIQNLGATNSNSVVIKSWTGSIGTANKGLGSPNNSGTSNMTSVSLGGTGAGAYAATAWDTSATGYIILSMKWSDAAATESWKSVSAWAELIP